MQGDKPWPDFIQAGFALKISDTAGIAVERFGQLDIDDLPVIDSDFPFTGIVHCDNLLSSLSFRPFSSRIKTAL
jgi:hypothetical protein